MDIEDIRKEIIKLLPLLFLLSCNEPQDSRPYQVYQQWTEDGKSYSVSIVHYGDTTKIFRAYDNRFYEERYYNDELMEVIEY